MGSVTPLRALVVANVEWYFLSHRLPLARALRECGCEVTVAAGVERDLDGAVRAEGFRFVRIPLERRSTRPWREARTFRHLTALYRAERPDVVHHISIKPVIYGSIAAKRVGLPAIINTVPGLGYTFLGRGLAGRLMRAAVMRAYGSALAGPNVRTIFQNPDDRALFVRRGIASAERSTVIRGSGVDVRRFAPAPEPDGAPVVVLASRLLWDKGVGELVAAAERLRAGGVSFRLVLVGTPDPENPRSIPPATLEQWQGAGVLEYWGHRDDMPDVLRLAAVVALPSYREGVPKVLLEAAASGRPIVATDVPGCREVVRPGENGLLVAPRDAGALADALGTLLADRGLRARMGARGREIVEAEFTEEHVIARTLAVYRDVLGARFPDAGARGAT